MTAIGRLVKLVTWLRTGAKAGAFGTVHDLRDAAEDVEWMLQQHEHLTEIARAARRLDKVLIEFGTNRSLIGDFAEALHQVLRAHPLAGELVIEELPKPMKGGA